MRYSTSATGDAMFDQGQRLRSPCRQGPPRGQSPAGRGELLYSEMTDSETCVGVGRYVLVYWLDSRSSRTDWEHWCRREPLAAGQDPAVLAYVVRHGATSTEEPEHSNVTIKSAKILTPMRYRWGA